jgi:hypothetical protein
VWTASPLAGCRERGGGPAAGSCGDAGAGAGRAIDGPRPVDRRQAATQADQPAPRPDAGAVRAASVSPKSDARVISTSVVISDPEAQAIDRARAVLEAQRVALQPPTGLRR